MTVAGRLSCVGMAAAQDKATVVAEWSAALHAAVGDQGEMSCTDAAPAMAEQNMINCFQVVNEDFSIKCTAKENFIMYVSCIMHQALGIPNLSKQSGDCKGYSKTFSLHFHGGF